jgi:hypothetical protein
LEAAIGIEPMNKGFAVSKWVFSHGIGTSDKHIFVGVQLATTFRVWARSV